MGKVLVISYSQSGQLHEIVDNVAASFGADEIERVHIEMEDPFPFPWTSDVFFNKMPECVMEEPLPIKPLNLKESKYDLIIFGYQPWFLSPSLPCVSVLKDPAFKEVIKDTPVVTVIGARNMWLNAHIGVKALLKDAGATLVGNVVLIDKIFNHISALTILYWMLTGKKQRMFGIFPIPGIKQKDIDEATAFSPIIKDALAENNFKSLQENMLELKKMDIANDILYIEGQATALFQIWAKAIKKRDTSPERRARWITFFKYYLIVALFVVAPIKTSLYLILVRPFKLKSVRRKKAEFLGVAYQ